MAKFFTILAKKYDPYAIEGAFSMNVHNTRCVPIVCTKQIADNGYGKATVNGVEISQGRCYSFSFSPMPIYLLPVGEVADEYKKEYTVRLSGYRAVDGSRFADVTFRIKVGPVRLADPRYVEHESLAKKVADEGMVLLANDGTLPLAEDTKVTLKGEFQNFRISPVGAGAIKPRWNLTIEQAIHANGKLRLAKAWKNGRSSVHIQSPSCQSTKGKSLL